jgi:hypothetical protein
MEEKSLKGRIIYPYIFSITFINYLYPASIINRYLYLYPFIPIDTQKDRNPPKETPVHPFLPQLTLTE